MQYFICSDYIFSQVRESFMSVLIKCIVHIVFENISRYTTMLFKVQTHNGIIYQCKEMTSS